MDGYEAGGFGEEDDQIVYVTDTGVVYHKNPHCTHLDLSIHAAASSELNSFAMKVAESIMPVRNVFMAAVWWKCVYY